MKKLLLPILLCISTTLLSQYQIGLIPRVSPDKSITEQVGYTKIEVTYGSPRTKGREIFGELVPFDQVWRAGANNATTITLSQDVLINERSLAAGEYGFFIIPKETGDWTAIFNSISKQWGSFRYADSKDVLRLHLKPVMNKHTESLRYSIEAIDTERASLFIDWAQTRLVLDIKVDNLKGISALLEERASTQSSNTSWVVYVQGAEYLVEQEQHLDQALSWLNKSEQLYTGIQEWRKEFYPKEHILAHLYWVKAKALALSGHVIEAKQYLSKLKDLGEVGEQFVDDKLVSRW